MGRRVTKASAPKSAVTYRVGGRQVVYKTVGNCHTCNSPYRVLVEKAVLHGSSYRAVMRQLPEGVNLSAAGIERHCRNHIDHQSNVLREIQTRRAEALGRDIAEIEQSLIDGVVLAEAIVQKSWEGMVDGDLPVTVRDGIEAAKFLRESGTSGQDLDSESYLQAFIEIHNQARACMDDEQFRVYSMSISHNPILLGLAQRWAQLHGQPTEQFETQEPLQLEVKPAKPKAKKGKGKRNVETDVERDRQHQERVDE